MDYEAFGCRALLRNREWRQGVAVLRRALFPKKFKGRPSLKSTKHCVRTCRRCVGNCADARRAARGDGERGLHGACVERGQRRVRGGPARPQRLGGGCGDHGRWRACTDRKPRRHGEVRRSALRIRPHLIALTWLVVKHAKHSISSLRPKFWLSCWMKCVIGLFCMRAIKYINTACATRLAAHMDGW